jgi:Fic family protein
MENFKLQPLPPLVDLGTLTILKKLPQAHRLLGELKGVMGTIPNDAILLNTLTLQEAKDSSEIENIITTHDELFQAGLFNDQIRNPAVKEVENYVQALRIGFDLVRTYKMLTNNFILKIQQELERNRAGFRKLPGTVLKNEQTGAIVYVPPQHPDLIIELMQNLEKYINEENENIDPLIKMAVIHYQFESIHPFYDGNGRTGRIINILFLIMSNLLAIPILYLSRYFIRFKKDYYQKLQDVREKNAWEDWVLFVLEGVSVIAQETINLIEAIKKLTLEYKKTLREQLPKVYSQDLLNNLFQHPYTKIAFMQKDLGVSRLTAIKYLEQIVKTGLLSKKKIGGHNYYVNEGLVRLIMDGA